jgi:hypothetical protein
MAKKKNQRMRSEVVTAINIKVIVVSEDLKLKANGLWKYFFTN